MEVDEQQRSPGVATKGMEEDMMNDNQVFDIPPGLEDDSPNFGSWLKPRSRSGRGCGRGRGGTHTPSTDRREGNDG